VIVNLQASDGHNRFPFFRRAPTGVTAAKQRADGVVPFLRPPVINSECCPLPPARCFNSVCFDLRYYQSFFCNPFPFRVIQSAEYAGLL